MNELLQNPSLRFAAGGPFLVAFVLLAALVLVVLGIREHASLAEPRRRRTLHALRAVTALAAAALALQPEWVVERVEHVHGKLTVLLDVSRSMQVREGEQTRLEQALGTLRDLVEASRDKPQIFGFGDALVPLSHAQLTPAAIVPHDDTRLERALRKLAGEHGRELGAVLVLSDGADRGGAIDEKALSQLGIRVHAVGFGSEQLKGDVSIEALQADPVAFLRQSSEVKVTVRAPPGQASSLPVALRLGEQLVYETEVALGADGVGTATLPFSPTRLGRAVYTLSAPVASEDPVPENNERAFLVRVTRERLRVLLVCGHPSWDARFLRSFLKNNPAIDLITFFILRTASDNSMAPPEELSLIPFPTEELFQEHLASFDLVIFQDFDFGPYQMGRYLPRIRQYVLEGGSFAMLGGDRSFGAGGYVGTPIEQVLPVKLASGQRTLDLGEFSPQVVAAATHHPLVELAPRAIDNIAAWKSLAPLLGTNLVVGTAEKARALLVHPTLSGRDGQPLPVLAVGQAGQGRTLSLTTDSSYRWGITTAGATGDASAYDRFWDRALRWLARDPLLEAAQVTTDRERYGPGARLRTSVWLRDESYEPLAGRTFRLTVSDHHGEVKAEATVVTDAQGRGSSELDAPTQPGGYTLAVRTEDDAGELAREGFVVESGGDELADPAAKHELLRRIAAATSGEYLRSDVGAERLASLPRSRAEVLGTVVRSPFASFWFFAFFALVCGLEWWLRRRFGLR